MLNSRIASVIYCRGMNSLQKRVLRGAVISLVLLGVGIAVWLWGNSRFDQAIGKQAVSFDIRNRLPAKEFDVDDFVHQHAINGLIFGLGVAFVVSGTVGLLLSAAVWIKKPAPGSVLTLRGWKSREEWGETAIARDKARNAALFGFLASGPWIFALCVGAFHLLISPSRLATDFIIILLVECGLLYGWGIHLCRRDRQQSDAASGPWKFALAVNYGGLCAFLCFMGTVFALRARA